MTVGKFLVKTIDSEEELRRACMLRYQVFQKETIGIQDSPDSVDSDQLDTDEYDFDADHLAIIDTQTSQIVATCRLNSSLFVNRFYTEQEFQCQELLDLSETKLEIGRVCVHPDFRRGAIILILWRAIAEYMIKTQTRILFGCGSVMTQDPKETALLYRHLLSLGKVRESQNIQPTSKYRFREFESLLSDTRHLPLTEAERVMAEAILPPLCQSYFDIGCYVPGVPAIDRDFKCIDFLTILKSDELNEKLRQKMFGI